LLAKRLSILLACSCFLVLNLFAPSARAQQPTWPLTGATFSSSVEELQKASAAVPAEKFAETTVLYEKDAYVLDASNRLTYRHTMVFRVESQAAVEGWAELRVRWAPWHQNQPEIRARVISPDGKVSTLDPKTITDGPAREDTNDTYTDQRVRKAPLPAVTVGAIVEEESSVSDKEPFFAGGVVYRDGLSRGVPLVQAAMTVDAPKELKLQYRVHNLPNARITDEEKDGVRHLTVTQGYQSGDAESDIDLPTHKVKGAVVEFSTGDSWSAIAQGYRKLAESQIDPEKARALLPAGLSGDRNGRIEKIVARLHKEIRYTGIEFGENNLQPATVADITHRHYGDCKDKAALLVGMLRAAGIPANMALLDSGPGLDVNPELPGMDQFDHAIVYVPAENAGGDPLWIDATADYAQVGTLPRMDRGRKALIIAENTTGLTEIPMQKPEDDKVIELRDVTMAEYGPSHITETSVTHGQVDAEYRSAYDGEVSRKTREDLEAYAKNTYLAKSLVSVQHGDAHDLTKPFDLKLEMSEARRANTQINDAAVAIPYSNTFYRLPKWFRTDPNEEGVKLTPQQEENRKRAVEARSKEFDVFPFVTEWRYTITPPVGFVLRALPEDKKIPMGPATLSQHYETGPQGVIQATLRFENPKDRYTLEEALALRDAVLAIYKQDIISIVFDQAGAKLVAAGKIKEGLAADRDLIAQHPKEGLHHAQVAYAYLKVGMGDRARAEARLAVKLDPKSPVGYRALGRMCQVNEIAQQWAPGFDWECAANALKQAVELEPDDTDTILNLAFLNEFDVEGERYTQKAHLAEAIRGYRDVKAKDKSTGDQYDDNILFDLLYSGQYKELLEEVEKLGSSATRRSMAIAASVALDGGDKGVQAGIARADRMAGGAQERSSALVDAGNLLVRMRLYPEAAGVLTAGADGQENAAAVTQQVSIFRSLKPWKDEFLPDTDPRSVVQRMFVASLTGSIDEAAANRLLARHAYATQDEWKENLKRAAANLGYLHLYASRSNQSATVLMDVIAGMLKLSAEGDDESGYRVTLLSLGAKPQHYFVSKEAGSYKVVTDGNTLSESGAYALYLLQSGRLKEAHALLDWTRDRLHKGGGDDPLSGPLLPRFWSVGDPADSAAMQLAADALLAYSKGIGERIPALRDAWQKAANEDARLNLALLLGTAYQTMEDAANLQAMSAEVLKKYPDSYLALGLAARADELQKNWPHWKQMLDAQIAKHSEDENLVRLKAEYAEAIGDFSLARETEQSLVTDGKASANDYNLLGWFGLFDGKLEGDSLKNAQQANLMTNNSSFAVMHTLACLYAATGKTIEARDLLLKAMVAANLTQPNDSVWYGLGSIYEQYGVNDAAIEAYRKVEKPTGHISSIDTWLLAEKRLAALTAAHP